MKQLTMMRSYPCQAHAQNASLGKSNFMHMKAIYR